MTDNKKQNDNNNIELNFTDQSMDDLSPNERLGVMYFAGINALKQKIEDNPKLLFKLALPKEDNVIFSTLFFLFVIITGNNPEVKNTILKCKEEEFKEKNVSDKEVNDYIDTFNVRVKDLAAIYLDVNGKVKGDLEFQQALVKAYSEYMMDNLAIDKNEDGYKELEIIFLSALKIAFGFRDAEKK